MRKGEIIKMTIKFEKITPNSHMNFFRTRPKVYSELRNHYQKNEENKSKVESFEAFVKILKGN